MLSMIHALCEKQGVKMSEALTQRLAQLLAETDVQAVAADLDADLPSVTLSRDFRRAAQRGDIFRMMSDEGLTRSQTAVARGLFGGRFGARGRVRCLA